MTTTLQIRHTLEQAQAQAGAIARSHPNNEQIRVLAIAIAETARVTAELAKHVRDLED